MTHEPPVSEPVTGMGQAAVRSVLWVAVARYGNLAVSIGLMAALTRLLTPADFGLVAMISVLTGFVTILAESGMSSAVIQHPEWDDVDVSTLFWWSLGVGTCCAIASWAAGPAVASFYGDSRLASLMAVAGLGFVLSAMARIPSGLLERRLAFRSLASVEGAGTLVSAAVALAAALLGAGYWTLIARELALHATRLVGRLWVARWWPRLQVRTAVLREALGFSSGITVFSSINYWSRNTDNLLIGRVLGAEALGQYSRAYALMMYPQDILTGVIYPVMHPILQRHRNEPDVMRAAWFQIVRLIALFSMPLMAALAVTAPEAVRLLWGPDWGPSVPVFQVLCAVGAVQPMISSVGALFLARGRTREMAIMGACNTAIMVAGIAVGVWQGSLVSTAVGFSVGYAIMAGPSLWWVTTRLLQGSLVELLRLMITPLWLALLAGLTSLAVVTLLRGQVPAAVVFAAAVVINGALWALALRWRERTWLLDMASHLPARAQGWLRRALGAP